MVYPNQVTPINISSDVTSFTILSLLDWPSVAGRFDSRVPAARNFRQGLTPTG